MVDIRMRKKILYLSLLVALLVIGGAGFALWKANDIVASYKPQIQQKLSQAIGTNVSLGDISVSIFPTTTMSIARVSIQDASGTSPAISIGSLEAHLALKPLLSKRLEISTITINSPRIKLTKDASGVIAPLVKKEAGPQAAVSSPASKSGSPASASALDINIESIAIRDGTFTLEDKSGNKTTEIPGIETDAAISLGKNGLTIPTATVSFIAPGAQKVNASLDTVTIAQPGNQISIKRGSARCSAGTIVVSGTFDPSGGPGSLDISSSGLDLANLTTIAKPFTDLPARYSTTGSMGVQVSARLVGNRVESIRGPVTLKSIGAALPNAMNLSQASGEVKINGPLNDLTIETSGLQAKLKDTPLTITSTIRIKPNEVTVTTLNVRGFGGEMQAPARLSVGASSILDLKPSAANISLEPVLKMFQPSLSSTIQGEVVSFRGDIQGIDLKQPAASARGSGSVSLRNGILRGFNIPHQVLSGIEGIPFISGNLRSKVPPEFEPMVAKPDMVIKELRAQFTLGNAAARFSELLVVSEVFTLKSTGTVGFDGKIDLSSEVLFNPEFSLGLTRRVREFKTLLDGSDRFVVPLTVKGTAPAVAVYPNVTSLVQKATVGTVRQTLGGAIGGGKDVTKSIGKILGF